MNRPDVAVIIVSYKVRELLRDCLESVLARRGNLSMEVIVVDNASNDGTAGMVTNEYPIVDLIRNSENVGYARAINQGLTRARGRYLLLLNPDTVVLDEFGKIIEFMDAHPSVAVVGPRLLNGDGTIQWSVRSFPNILNMSLLALGLYNKCPKTPILFSWLGEAWDQNRTAKVPYVLGAAMFVRSSICHQLGGMDESYFMYSEEKDFCYRAQKIGAEIWYWNDTRVLHYGGASSKQRPGFALVSLYQSHRLFLRKHYTRLNALILSRILDLGLFGKMVLHLVVDVVLRGCSVPLSGRAQHYAMALGIKSSHLDRSEGCNPHETDRG